ncbi:hypothetical protein TrST_g8996 [Triparma strigata]|uniref:Uncharacterized protein n=1 Tax=Triparma strigata TaxID=1606541 RepID=A0A9W7BPV8_9STRA|nr:hypothetical protein TrST_g8996 [Triparma strigata]
MGSSASRDRFLESLNSLATTAVSPDDSDFWDELWKLPTTNSEVFSTFTPGLIRTIRSDQFNNLETLFTQATAQMCQIVETPYSIYFDQALNCVRVLTRITPFLIEIDPNHSEIHTILSKQIDEMCFSVPAQKHTEVLGGEDEGEAQPLALLVVHAAMHMLFLPQFTADYYDEEDYDDEDSSDDEDSDRDSDGSKRALPAVEVSGKKGPKSPQSPDGLDTKLSHQSPPTSGGKIPFSPKSKLNSPSSSPQGRPPPPPVDRNSNSISLAPSPSSLIWSPSALPGFIGNSSKKASNPENAYTSNRLEVLLLLLTLSSEPLFHTTTPPRYLPLLTSPSCPNAPLMFYSLLNTVLGYNPRSSSIPYGSAFGNQSEILTSSLHLLNVLLSYGEPCEILNKGVDEALKVSKKDTGNVYATLLLHLSSEDDMIFCCEGFIRLLNNAHLSLNTYLPLSVERLECFEEVLTLFWFFLRNESFKKCLLEVADVNKIVVPLCYLMLEENSNADMVRICTLILLKLTGEREFSVALNRPFNTHLPTSLPLFRGTHCDLLALTMCTKAQKSDDPSFIVILANVSPYMMSLSLVTSSKIMSLLKFYAERVFWKGSLEKVGWLVEVVNNIVQYQFSGNSAFVYACIRGKAVFERMNLSAQDITEGWLKTQRKLIAANKKHLLIAQPGEGFMEVINQTIQLATIDRLLGALAPKIDKFAVTSNGVVDEQDLLDYIKKQTLVGILPVPHAIIIRKYEGGSGEWLRCYLWGIVFLKVKWPVWDGGQIRLFKVNTE